MNLFELLRFFLPLQNPAGYGLADFIELGAAVLLVTAILLRDRTAGALRKVAANRSLAILVPGAAPIVLRLLLLRLHPVPMPAVADDFSYLLLGDTLAHFRLANPVHPMHRFFETVFVLQAPAYSSIFPPGQGLALALGELLFHLPWAGVLLSMGALCAGVGWMLRGWVKPVWALVGALLAVIQFGPLNQWMNNYWGGAVSGLAGCLVFGSLPRLWAHGRRRDATLLGAGLGLQAIARPFEAVLLAICVLPALIPLRAHWRRLLPMSAMAALPFLCLIAMQNKAVTGSFVKLPYMLSREQYGVPATFTFEAMSPAPRRELTQEQKLDYEAQTHVHDEGGGYFMRLASRIRFVRFFFLAPLYVALAFFLPCLRRARYAWLAGSTAVFMLGTNIYPYFYPHYIAALTGAFVLMTVAGLERLWRLNSGAARLIVLLCLVHFTFWYSIHLLGSEDLLAATGARESWDYINFSDSEGRAAVAAELTKVQGKQLVFVRYGPAHPLREWVHNDADIDASAVVWALDLGEEEDAALRRYYPDRAAWLVEPDARPPKLARLRQEVRRSVSARAQ